MGFINSRAIAGQNASPKWPDEQHASTAAATVDGSDPKTHQTSRLNTSAQGRSPRIAILDPIASYAYHQQLRLTAPRAERTVDSRQLQRCHGNSNGLQAHINPVRNPGNLMIHFRSLSADLFDVRLGWRELSLDHAYRDAFPGVMHSYRTSCFSITIDGVAVVGESDHQLPQARPPCKCRQLHTMAMACAHVKTPGHIALETRRASTQCPARLAVRSCRSSSSCRCQ